MVAVMAAGPVMAVTPVTLEIKLGLVTAGAGIVTPRDARHELKLAERGWLRGKDRAVPSPLLAELESRALPELATNGDGCCVSNGDGLCLPLLRLAGVAPEAGGCAGLACGEAKFNEPDLHMPAA